jgi:hypothetical protein
LSVRSKITLRVMKLFAAKFYELYILANVGSRVRLVNEVRVRDQVRQIKSIPERGDVHETSNPQQMRRQRGAQEPQNYGPSILIGNLKICEKFSH